MEEWRKSGRNLKIEAIAEEIHFEAQNNAKEITNLSQQEAEKLFTNSKAPSGCGT